MENTPDNPEGDYNVNITVNNSITFDDSITTKENYIYTVTGATGQETLGNVSLAVVEIVNVTVTGDITGGSVTANPDTLAARNCTSSGGSGIRMGDATNVTVRGNVQGGSTNGGEAGAGVYLTYATPCLLLKWKALPPVPSPRMAMLPPVNAAKTALRGPTFTSPTPPNVLQTS